MKIYVIQVVCLLFRLVVQIPIVLQVSCSTSDVYFVIYQQTAGNYCKMLHKNY